MYFIERILADGDATPTSSATSFLVTGRSGKLYTVSLPDGPSSSILPRCNCMDQLLRKSVCKHVIFICVRVLKAPRSWFATEEYGAEILDALGLRMHTYVKRVAEPTAPAALRAAVARALPGTLATPVERREVEEGDECGICCEELQGEKLQFCGFGCGRAVHEACFARYRKVSKEVRCVLCRAMWQKVGVAGIGRRGLLVGRRLVDVSESIREMEMEEEEKEEEEGDWMAEQDDSRNESKRKSKRQVSKSRVGRKEKEDEVNNNRGKRGDGRGRKKQTTKSPPKVVRRRKKRNEISKRRRWASGGGSSMRLRSGSLVHRG